MLCSAPMASSGFQIFNEDTTSKTFLVGTAQRLQERTASSLVRASPHCPLCFWVTDQFQNQPRKIQNKPCPFRDTLCALSLLLWLPEKPPRNQMESSSCPADEQQFERVFTNALGFLKYWSGKTLQNFRFLALSDTQHTIITDSTCIRLGLV